MFHVFGVMTTVWASLNFVGMMARFLHTKEPMNLPQRSFGTLRSSDLAEALLSFVHMAVYQQ